MKSSAASCFALGLVFLLGTYLYPTLALAQTDNWLGGAGNWSNGAMWSAGLPGSGSNVFIDNGNAKVSAVTLDLQAQINNLTIDSDDSLSFNNGTNLTINGSTISNSGTISLNSLGSLTYVFIANGATLTGTGTVIMSNNSQNAFDGNGGATLTNKSTIQGAGQIGDHFTLANQGTINANVSGATLAVTDDSNATDTNTATLEATNGGILQIRASGSGNINNTGGTIKAVGTNSQVLLQSLISGGTLTTSSGGTIVQPVSTSSTLTGVTNSGTFSVLNNGTVNLSGTLTNTGNIQLNSTGSLTLLFTPNSATLTGAGTVSMSNNSQNAVDGNGGASFTNQSTIQGGGQVGPHVTLANQGTINANVSGAALLVSQQSGAVDTNSGTLEATNGGILQLATSGSGAINNSGGTIEAVGANSQVQFMGFGTVINGGTLSSGSGGQIVLPAGLSATLNGVTSTGTFLVQNGAFLNLIGTITNSGSIAVNSTGSLTELFLPSGDVTLAGKGHVILNNNPNSVIDGNGGLTLTNHNTIQGGGTIGPHFNFTNLGTLHVTAKNTLNINGPFSNFAGNTLTGGTYTVAGALRFTNANIVTNSAKITLTGAKAQITDQNGTNALVNFTTNSKTGSFSLMSGNLLTTSGSVTNAGKLKVGPKSGLQTGSGSYTQTAGQTTVDGVLTASAGVSIQAGKVFGKGSIVATVVSDGTVTAGDSTSKAGQLSMSTYTQNPGASLNIQIGGTTVGTQYSQLAVSNGVKLNGTLAVKLISGFVPAVGNTFTIVTGSAITSQFSTVNLPTLSGAHFVVNYNPTNVTLTVVSG